MSSYAIAARQREPAAGLGRTRRRSKARIAERARTHGLAAELEGALRRAELEVFYQPIVDAASQQVVCFEALVRWHHPVRGQLAPDEFIPLAEEAGLMDALGDYVLKRACEQCSAWPSHIKVAVNFSAIQFGNPSLVVKVAAALVGAGLAPDRLELEITETAPLPHDDLTLGALRGLRALGVRIAMDDFGTGYSTLSRLPQFPFDKVKLDRSFLRELPGSAHAGRMLGAVAAMARALDIALTVEGVESEDQVVLAGGLGCAQMQGFAFGRPMPASEAAALIASDAARRHAA
jgi:EAL domain-containing protein (putative c-di-GMP-specific phosphodiesterase class I)